MAETWSLTFLITKMGHSSIPQGLMAVRGKACLTPDQWWTLSASRMFLSSHEFLASDSPSLTSSHYLAGWGKEMVAPCPTPHMANQHCSSVSSLNQRPGGRYSSAHCPCKLTSPTGSHSSDTRLSNCCATSCPFPFRLHQSRTHVRVVLCTWQR